MTVGERITDLREKVGFTQKKLAQWSGVSQTHLRRIELGEADVTVGYLKMICDALGVTLKDFFAEDDDRDEVAKCIASLSHKQRQLLLTFLNSLQHKSSVDKKE